MSWERWFLTERHWRLWRKYPRTSSRSRTYDLQVTSPDALPRSYRRIVGTKATKQVQISTDKKAITAKRHSPFLFQNQPSIFWRTVKKEQELSRNAKMIFGEVNLTVTIFIFVVRPKAKCTRWSLVRKRFLFTVTWATLDAEMEGGRWPWRLMAQR